MDNTSDLQKKFDLLPQAVKDAITSVDFATNLQEIGKNHGLHLDELDTLFEEVGLVMLGETNPRDFKSKIAKRLSITEAKVDPLVKTLDEKIFRPIKIALIEASSVAKPEVAATFSQTMKSAAPAPVSVPAAPAPAPSPIAPPIIKPHQADYNMSRDAILSAIENPPLAEVKLEYTPRRQPEPTDPSKYLEKRQGLSALMEKVSDDKKHSLSEAAVMVAKQKTDVNEKIAVPPKVVLPAVSPKPAQVNPPTPALPIVAKVVPTFAVLPKEPIKPSDKLTAPIQIPSSKIEVKAPLPIETKTQFIIKKSAVDPYREVPKA